MLWGGGKDEHVQWHHTYQSTEKGEKEKKKKSNQIEEIKMGQEKCWMSQHMGHVLDP